MVEAGGGGDGGRINKSRARGRQQGVKQRVEVEERKSSRYHDREEEEVRRRLR